MENIIQKPFPLIYNKNSKHQSASNFCSSLIENRNKKLFYNRLFHSKSTKDYFTINKKRNDFNNYLVSRKEENSNFLYPNSDNISFMDYIRKNPYKKSIIKGLILKMQNKKTNILNHNNNENKKPNKKKFSELNLELNYAYRKINLGYDNKNNKKMVILLQGNKSVYDSIIKETILSKVHDSFRNDFIKKRIKNSISSELFN
jgi:hypothetical protein